MQVQKIIIKNKAIDEVLDALLATLMWDYFNFFSDLSVPPEKKKNKTKN